MLRPSVLASGHSIKPVPTPEGFASTSAQSLFFRSAVAVWAYNFHSALDDTVIGWEFAAAGTGTGRVDKPGREEPLPIDRRAGPQVEDQRYLIGVGVGSAAIEVIMSEQTEVARTAHGREDTAAPIGIRGVLVNTADSLFGRGQRPVYPCHGASACAANEMREGSDAFCKRSSLFQPHRFVSPRRCAPRRGREENRDRQHSAKLRRHFTAFRVLFDRKQANEVTFALVVELEGLSGHARRLSNSCCPQREARRARYYGANATS